jgi:hypothetical protein
VLSVSFLLLASVSLLLLLVSLLLLLVGTAGSLAIAGLDSASDVCIISLLFLAFLLLLVFLAGEFKK